MTSQLKLILPITALLLGGCKTLDSEKSVELGQTYLHHEQWQKAADVVAPVVEAAPGNWRAQLVFGQAQAALGNLPAAKSALERAYDADPRNEEAIYALAGVLFRQENPTALFGLLRSAGQQLHSAGAYVKLAEYAMRLNDLDSAKAAIQVAIEVDDGFSRPRTDTPYYAAAVLERRAGSKDTAIRRLRQAYGINPLDERVLHALRELGVEIGPNTALPPGV